MDDATRAEFAARSAAVTLERVALAVAVGSTSERDVLNMTVSAVPEDPDEDPITQRRFFVEVNEASYAEGGFLNGTVRRRYELTLTPVDDDDVPVAPARP